MNDRDEFVWLRQELPWIGAGFIHRIPRHGTEVATAALKELGFEVWTLEGSSMTDAQNFHTEAARSFGFPSYYGQNWDAFNDCFGELELPRRLAIVWSAANRLAAADLKTFAEAVCMLHVHIDARSRTGIQLELLIEEEPPEVAKDRPPETG